jgi:hypothetical protein
MIVLILRIFATGLFLYMISIVSGYQSDYTEAGDTTPALLMVGTVVTALFASMTWAPFLGNLVAGPLMGNYIGDSVLVDRFLTIRLIRWLDARHWRRAALVVCFWEGLNRPWMPTSFVVGMKTANPHIS